MNAGEHAARIRVALDLGLQAWRTTDSRTRFHEAFASLSELEWMAAISRAATDRHELFAQALAEIESFPISGYHAGAAQRIARAVLAESPAEPEAPAAEADRGRLALEAATADQDWKRAEAERDRLAAELAEARAQVEALVLRASREPLDIDISDFGDEFCAGYLAGQENALLVADRALAAVVRGGGPDDKEHT